jgi:hypothetical protein
MNNPLKTYYYYSINYSIETCLNRIANRFCHDDKYKGKVYSESFSFRKKVELLNFTFNYTKFVRYVVRGEFIKKDGNLILKITFSYNKELLNFIIITILVIIMSIIISILSNDFKGIKILLFIIPVSIYWLFICKLSGKEFLKELEWILEHPRRIKRKDL